MSQQDLVIVRLDAAKQALSEAKTLSEAKEIMDIAAAALTYARRHQLGEEACRYASEIKLRAQLKLAEIYQGGEKATGGDAQRTRYAIGTESPPTLRELGIDRHVSSEGKQLLALPKETRDKVVAGTVSVTRALRDAREKKSAENLHKSVSIKLPSGFYHGDFRELSSQIPDSSVDLVFTDPPYDSDSVSLFGDAAKVAARILKNGGSFMAYSGTKHLPQVYAAIEPHLRYWWTCACIHGGTHQILQKLGLRSGWKPMVWYVKGTRGDIQQVLQDTVTGFREKDKHPWQQSQSEAEYFISKLTVPDALVVDFFMGSGTTAAACKSLKRRFIGYEIDAESLEKSANRVK